MATLAEIQAKKDADAAAKKDAAAGSKETTPKGTHRDGESSTGQIPKDKIQSEGQDVIVKNSVVETGNKDNRVTAAVANDVANLTPSEKLAPMDAHMEKVQNSAGEAMLSGAIETVSPSGAIIKSSQNPPIVASAEPSSVARTSNIDTGREVSQPKYMGDTPIAEVLAEEPLSDEVAKNLKEKAKGIYQAGNIKRVFRPNGTVMNPEKDGNYYPQTDAEAAELEHFAKDGRVKRLSAPPPKAPAATPVPVSKEVDKDSDKK